MINTIIQRGYALDEEYQALITNSAYRAWRFMFWTDDYEERFHGVILDEKHFVMCNGLIFFRGPRTLVGMVAAYRMVGTRYVMDKAASVALIEKAGQEAVAYANRTRTAEKNDR